MDRRKVNAFFRPKPPAVPASSSAFPSSDPFEPLPPSSRAPAPAPRTLAVEIQPAVLRPIAFRVFTKKHNLTLKSNALALLCPFVGRRCGADWRDSGAGEKLLDEIARQWKRNEGAAGILVDGDEALKSVLRGLDVPGGGAAGGGDLLLLRRTQSFDLGAGVPSSALYDGEIEAHMGGGGGGGEVLEGSVDPRRFLKVVDSFAMPKWNYNVLKRGFERAPKPALLPPASAKTLLFRTRYALLHQRLLRTDLFLPPTFTAAAAAPAKAHHKLTPIANLLGRAGQSFLLFGMLGINPSGVLTLLDNTGEIVLDLSIATAIPADGSWFTPGAFCIVDGAFEDDSRFTVFTLGQPLPERREATAEIFGHMDFLGTGVTLDMSAGGGGGGGGGGQQGRAMRRAEKAAEDVKMVFCGEVELDAKGTLDALRCVFEIYAEDPPMVVCLLGNFTTVAMGTNGGSVGYKEYFDQLASLLSDFPTLTAATTFIFVPGDNDPWASTFSGGSSTTLPRKGIPDIFTSRIKRVFQQQQSSRGGGGGGEAQWVSNPCRVGYFTQELVIFRDDIAGRLRRNGISFKKGEDGDEMDVEEGGEEHGDYQHGLENEDYEMEFEASGEPKAKAKAKGKGKEKEVTVAENGVDQDIKNARKLVKTVLDQGYLAPFSLATRPMLWDYWHTLMLYPLPNVLILSDPAMQPFSVTYEGCHVMNPGRMVERRTARWVEYMPATGGGSIRDVGF